MLQIDALEMRESARREWVNDAPQRLRELTDIQKGGAIAVGINRVSGGQFDARVETVRYGAIDRSRAIRCPAEIRLTVTPLCGEDCRDMLNVSDLELEQEIADSLAMAAEEDYQVRVLDKSYLRRTAHERSIRLTVHVGRKTPA
jgi:hypothetical protein